MKYDFYSITVCNMCGADVSSQRVLGKRLNKSQGKKPSQQKGLTVTIVRCRNCNLIFSNPMPVPESINDHYGTPPENYWKPAYFNIDPNYFSTQIKTFKKLMPEKSGMKSLDIGAGLGKAMISLKNAGFDSYGFEPSAPFFERAINAMKIDKERLQLASIESAYFPDEYFDFITFGAVLEHLYDPSKSIAKAMTWLKPGGLIHIEVPSSKWLVNKVANFYYKITGTDYVANISPMHAPFHLYEFGLKSFSENSKINSYEIVQHCYYVANTYLPQPLSAILKKIMKFSQTGEQLEVWLRKKNE